MTSRRLLGGSLLIFFGMFAMKFSLLVRDMFLSSVFGLNIEVALYLSAFVIPMIITNHVGTAFQVATTPFLVKHKKISWSVAGEVFTKIGIVAIGTYLLVYPLLSSLFEFSRPEYWAEFYEMFWIFFAYLLLTPLRLFFGQVLYVNGRYLFNFVPSVLSPIFSIMYLVLSPTPSVLVVAYLVSITAIFECLLIVWRVRSLGFIDTTPAIALAWRELSPGLLIQFLIGSNLLLDQIFAQQAGETFLGVFNYASKLPNILSTISTIITSSVLLPFFQEKANAGEPIGLRLSPKLLLRILAVVVITVLMYFSSTLITSLLYERGNFTRDRIEAVASFQSLYFLMAPLTAIFIAYIRYLGTIGKTRKAFFYGGISFLGICLVNTYLLSDNRLGLIPFSVLPGYLIVACIESFFGKARSAR